MSSRPFQLPRSVKAEIYQRVQSAGLNPSDFTWGTFQQPPLESGEEVYHHPTGSYLRVSPGTVVNCHFWASWNPPNTAGERYGPVVNMPALLVFCSNWLQYVKREAETPDFWAMLAAEKELIASEATESDRPFTASEIALLKERLKVLEGEIVRIAGATAGQAGRLKETFQAASDAAERLNRKEWKLLFVGVLVQEVVSLALDPARAQQVFHLATIYVGPIIAHVKGLLS